MRIFFIELHHGIGKVIHDFAFDDADADDAVEDISVFGKFVLSLLG